MGRSRGRKERRERPADAIQGFLWNAGALAIVAATLDLPPVAIGFWGLGLAAHGAAIAPTLAAAWRARRARAAPAAEGGNAPGAAAAASDPFLADLDRALAALAGAARGALPPGIDFPALRREAEALRARHLALAAVAGPAERDRLAAERDDALARAEGAADPRTAEVLRAQATSVGERLAAVDEASAAAARLEARERTLLHQLEALRVSLVHASLDESRAPDLAAEVRSIQLDVRATAELEGDLARARLGASRRRQPT